MRVCQVPCDFDGSGMYRLAFPGRQLEVQYGWECRVPPHIPPMPGGRGRLELYEFNDLDLFVERIAPDVLVMQRPVDVSAPTLIRMARAAGIRVVVETDDWMAGLPSWNPAFEKLDARFSPMRNVQVFAACAKLADLVTVSTPFLADWYARVCRRRPVVLRNFLEWAMWKNTPPVYEARTWERTRVGYMGDARWHKGDLMILAGLIVPWLERHPDVDFVGSPQVLDLLEIPVGQRVETDSGVVKLFDLPRITAVFDIGLVPLAVSKFNEAKSHLKGMEYAACGIPCVASSTEGYRHWVESGVNGFLARRPRDFVRHLDALVADRDLVVRMGMAAREKAMMHTIDKHAHLWADTYQALVEEKAA